MTQSLHTVHSQIDPRVLSKVGCGGVTEGWGLVNPGRACGTGALDKVESRLGLDWVKPAGQVNRQTAGQI